MLNKILYSLKLKKRPDVDRGKILKAFPLRNQLITWEMDDKGEASLVIPQKDKFWIRLTSKLFMLPDKRVVVLDSIGAYVWQMCDGEHTISQIIKALQKKHQLTRKEAETSLFTFIQQLGKRNFHRICYTDRRETEYCNNTCPRKTRLFWIPTEKVGGTLRCI